MIKAEKVDMKCLISLIRVKPKEATSSLEKQLFIYLDLQYVYKTKT